ncbi:hypothetical protein MTX78_24000 (plasmid) [Hymenobacter tibetensis]|uniref:Uncharacterized protein n=1 Tax=Hymenobacter tibetensis TaxID=497967 RepID=A0ABY4D4H3_9BACT|nr:hypothetical protein [Hymenobacter tibetensis]UOG77410.1 hypothetical protein MTX78_24000 [Hymenobacter tibetensis]
MKIILLVFLVFSSLLIQAQNPSSTQTDSSTIESKIYPGGREVKETVTKRDLVYYRFYRNNTPQVTSTATYNKSGRSIGVSKEYDDDGKLLYSIDHDHGSWNVANKSAYPFYSVQQQMKRKADELIAATYGREFLKNHVIWSVDGSYIYNQAESGNWSDSFSSKPTKFLFRYDVKLDKTHVYKELIQFELDQTGKFIPNEFEAVSGFEKLAQVPAQGFNLSYKAAIEATKQKSGIRNQPLQGFLKWESLKKPSFYNGHFRFYVPIKTGSVENLNPKGRSSVTDQFDVYSFNPWTGAFIEKKKMKAVRSWEENSGSSTGLMPTE